ncbi:hypothetical protein [Streptomyces sp. NPDC101249]|uniref:hypothetical protein n=1 Tax=Streptomyces sp. NPDC101249 TaxID=3366140 RepID=UPI00381D78B6
MDVDRPPHRVREFTHYLAGLLARVDDGGGWCGVFWQRDPDGMRACLDGREIPPWDVVEALLQDLAAAQGPQTADRERDRARTLHLAALGAHDARPGGRDALGDRLDVMLREQRYAAERQAELGRLLTAATTREAADALRLDLAWARDDHARATARCAELRLRITESDRRSHGGHGGGTQPPDPVRHGRGTGVPQQRVPGNDGRHDTHRPHDPQDPHGGHEPYGGHESYDGHEPYEGYGRDDGYGYGRDDGRGGGPGHPGEAAGERGAPPGGAAPDRPSAPGPAARSRRRRRGGARFAGMAGDAEAVVPSPGPEPPDPGDGGRRTPRGARFAGGAAEQAPAEPPPPPQPDAGQPAEVVEAVRRLLRLRAEGRSGEAHVLLVECAHWPAALFPPLAAELRRAGLGADWATLLWEAASLPADRLVAAADALAASGRPSDGEQMLRQGAARPAAEIAGAVLDLLAQGRGREAGALLDAYVRVRTPEEAARSAEPDPATLVPLLLSAARGVSERRHRDLVHALRVAGLAG